jgi:hypothetical protein
MVVITNKIFVALIAVFILAFISFFIGLQLSVYPVTGFATNNATGVINITVVGPLMIELLNDSVNMGACEINTSKGYSLLNSEEDSFYGDNGDCLGDFPSSIVVLNDGSWPVNVTIAVSDSPNSFFGDNSSWLAYRTHNLSGCLGVQSDWLNLTNETQFRACDSLATNSSSFELSLLTYISANATGGGSLYFLFSAGLAS